MLRTYHNHGHPLSLKDLRDFPEAVKGEVGYALYIAQQGDKHPDAKPLKGLDGAHVLEVAEDFDGNTYRAVYTVRFESGIYVLHAFQKKAKHGVSTPQQDLELIKNRMKTAQAQDLERQKRKRE